MSSSGMQMKPEHYAPVIAAAIAVFLFGMMNPKFMRETDKEVERQKGDNPPSFKWLALIALLVGMLCVWMINN